MAENNVIMLTDVEAAKLLHLGRTKFRQLVDTGKTPAPVRFGRSVRWVRADLVQWVKVGCPTREKWDAIKKDMGSATTKR